MTSTRAPGSPRCSQGCPTIRSTGSTSCCPGIGLRSQLRPRPPDRPRAVVASRLRLIESFNARLRDELLDGEIFYSLAEARIVIESWRRHYNTERPHGSLGYKPPAPEIFIPALAARPAPQPRPAPGNRPT